MLIPDKKRIKVADCVGRPVVRQYMFYPSNNSFIPGSCDLSYVTVVMLVAMRRTLTSYQRLRLLYVNGLGIGARTHERPKQVCSALDRFQTLISTLRYSAAAFLLDCWIWILGKTLASNTQGDSLRLKHAMRRLFYLICRINVGPTASHRRKLFPNAQFDEFNGHSAWDQCMNVRSDDGRGLLPLPVCTASSISVNTGAFAR